MSKTLIKRVYPEYFQQMLGDGGKNFEIRLGTFKAEVGDILWLKEYDRTMGYTGRELQREITTMIRTNDLKFWTKAVKDAHGFVIMGLKEPDELLETETR